MCKPAKRETPSGIIVKCRHCHVKGEQWLNLLLIDTAGKMRHFNSFRTKHENTRLMCRLFEVNKRQNTFNGRELKVDEQQLASKGLHAL